MQLVFADSEVARVLVQGRTLQLQFAAAAVEPSAAGGEPGYLLGLVLELQGARWTGEPSTCFGRLREGSLAEAATRFTRLELPFDGPGPWIGEFAFVTGAQLVVHAERASALLGRGERFRASFAC